jgi:hypothetical protein
LQNRVPIAHVIVQMPPPEWAGVLTVIRIFLVLGVLGLSACDLPQSYAQAPKPDKAEQPPASGARVSGYARVGVSHHF